MGVIATLLPTPGHVRRVHAAIRDRHEVVPCDDWSTLQDVCERQPVRVAILDLFATGRAAFERVRILKQRRPRLTLVGYVTLTTDRVHDLFDAGRQGLDALVIADRDDAPRALLAVIEQAESRSLGGVLRRSLEGIDPAALDAVLLSVTRAHERLSPDGLARLLALPRRTVSDRLAVAGFPPPRHILTWGRLIVAAHLLEDPHRSAEQISIALEFPSGSAFRNSCQRYLRATPGEIRERGGAAWVIESFLIGVGRGQRGDGPANEALPPEPPQSDGPRP